MPDAVLERLAQLEEAVRRASEHLVQLRADNERLRRELAHLGDERRQVVSQIDAILKDIAKLELSST